MTKIFCTADLPKVTTRPGRISRLLVSVVMSISLAACAAAPSKPVATDSEPRVQSSTPISTAAQMYNDGDYAGALYAFDKIGKDQAASANSRRLAHLGEALIYLGADKQLHSVPNAKMALVSAGQVKAGEKEEFSVETNMLLEAVSFVIGTESKFEVLQEKSGGSNFEVTKLKKENAQLQNERDTLLAEQKNLKDALEKLKKLTLGN